MNRFSAVFLTATALTLAVGCGGGKDTGLKGGDKLEVLEALERVDFEASYGTNAKSPDHTEGGKIDVPAGTVLEVKVSARTGMKMVEVGPVKSNTGVTDDEALKELFVPERYRRPPEKPEDTFLYYTISLPLDYLGTKIKKVE